MRNVLAAVACLAMSSTAAMADLTVNQYDQPLTTFKDSYGDVQFGVMVATVDGITIGTVKAHIIRASFRQGDHWSMPVFLVTDCGTPARYVFDSLNIAGAVHAHPGSIIESAIEKTCSYEVDFHPMPK